MDWHINKTDNMETELKMNTHIEHTNGSADAVEKKERKAPVRKPILVTLGAVKAFKTQAELEEWMNSEEGQGSLGTYTIITGGTTRQPKPVTKMKLR